MFANQLIIRDIMFDENGITIREIYHPLDKIFYELSIVFMKSYNLQSFAKEYGHGTRETTLQRIIDLNLENCKPMSCKNVRTYLRIPTIKKEKKGKQWIATPSTRTEKIINNKLMKEMQNLFHNPTLIKERIKRRDQKKEITEQ